MSSTTTVVVDAAAKEQRLRAALAELPSLIVAFSGGADSAYLAWVAHETLGARVLAVTATSASLPERERRFVADFARRHGLRHEFIRTDELANPLYVANHPDRCYHCKDELFAQLGSLARARGFAAVAYGVNCDDLGDFRPGQQAAREHRVLTPLVDAGLTKAEIRQLSRRAGLETWDKPAAACLASRLAYGVAVTEDVLKRIEQAEDALRALGFRQLRVRYHTTEDTSQAGQGFSPDIDSPRANSTSLTKAVAQAAGRSDIGRVDISAGQNSRPLGPEGLVRIEIAPDELPRALAPEMAARIRDALRPLGFKFITLDLEGYRQGSLNPTT